MSVRATDERVAALVLYPTSARAQVTVIAGESKEQTMQDTSAAAQVERVVVLTGDDRDALQKALAAKLQLQIGGAWATVARSIINRFDEAPPADPWDRPDRPLIEGEYARGLRKLADTLTRHRLDHPVVLCDSVQEIARYVSVIGGRWRYGAGDETIRLVRGFAAMVCPPQIILSCPHPKPLPAQWPPTDDGPDTPLVTACPACSMIAALHRDQDGIPQPCEECEREQAQR